MIKYAVSVTVMAVLCGGCSTVKGVFKSPVQESVPVPAAYYVDVDGFPETIQCTGIAGGTQYLQLLTVEKSGTRNYGFTGSLRVHGAIITHVLSVRKNKTIGATFPETIGNQNTDWRYTDCLIGDPIMKYAVVKKMKVKPQTP